MEVEELAWLDPNNCQFEYSELLRRTRSEAKYGTKAETSLFHLLPENDNQGLLNISHPPCCKTHRIPVTSE